MRRGVFGFVEGFGEFVVGVLEVAVEGGDGVWEGGVAEGDLVGGVEGVEAVGELALRGLGVGSGG